MFYHVVGFVVETKPAVFYTRKVNNIKLNTC